ncbi:MAG: HU family DNA-binding protein [Melioribacteraceae bacterium]|jgi:DNA-binding protein HU-beta|nr:HU family DNA-binding protein [Melioribacteraceae bacterium]WKZ69145.1 MAG: HU family DNA-binding protein [Melioribacteraceae bacterium]
MAKSMTKAEIVDHLAGKVGTTKKQATEFLNTFVELTYKQAKNEFVIPGLGKVSVGKRKARMGRNPQTGAALKIPASKVLKFKFAKAAKDAVIK